MSHTKGKLKANGSKLVCDGGYAIATVNSVGTYEGQANAKRIVQCWNSHDALVEALTLESMFPITTEAELAAIEKYAESLGWKYDNPLSNFAQEYRNNALKSAKGEQP